MAKKLDIKPKLYGKQSFCKVEKNGSGVDVVIVGVENIGDILPSDLKLSIQLKYGTYQTHTEEVDLSNLKKFDFREVTFPLPQDQWFDPDCEYEIQVDAFDELKDETNKDNNFASGVLRRVMKPNKMVVPDHEEPSFEEVKIIFVKVKNEDKFANGQMMPKVTFKMGHNIKPGRPEKTNKLKCEEEDALKFQIPPEFVNKPYTIEIAIDADNQGKSKIPDLNQTIDEQSPTEEKVNQ